MWREEETLRRHKLEDDERETIKGKVRENEESLFDRCAPK